jgi:hypothetical protein
VILAFLTSLLLLRTQQLAPVIYLEPGKTTELSLIIEADSSLLVNHVNPVLVTLHSAFGDISQDLKGLPWEQKPELYWDRLEPIKWKWSVPSDTQPGIYPFVISSELALCNYDIGICYLEPIELKGNFNVSKQQENKPLKLQLIAAKF